MISSLRKVGAKRVTPAEARHSEGCGKTPGQLAELVDPVGHAVEDRVAHAGAVAVGG